LCAEPRSIASILRQLPELSRGRAGKRTPAPCATPPHNRPIPSGDVLPPAPVPNGAAPSVAVDGHLDGHLALPQTSRVSNGRVKAALASLRVSSPLSFALNSLRISYALGFD
jgi:hypothetical protein